MIDNPFFTVNQRGASSYTANGYSFDRWEITGNSTDFSVNKVSNGVSLVRNVSAGYITLTQSLEVNRLIVEKTYTASVLYSDGTVISESFTSVASGSPSQRLAYIHNSSNGTELIIDFASDKYYAIVQFDGNYTYNPIITAVKLEVGSVSTLAMDTVPNYATELLKCQRYFYRIGFSGSSEHAIGMANLTTRATMILNLPVTMRATPTISTTGTSYLYNGATTTAITAISGELSDYGLYGESIMTLFVDSTDLTIGNTYMLRTSSSHIDFSADL